MKNLAAKVIAYAIAFYLVEWAILQALNHFGLLKYFGI